MKDSKDRAAAYLLSRGAPKDTAEAFSRLSSRIDCLGKSFDNGDFAYGIDHFLDSSGKAGFDIELVNKTLGIEHGPMVAVALAEGDDPICINLDTGEVVLWLVEDGEAVQLSCSFGAFASMIIGGCE